MAKQRDATEDGPEVAQSHSHASNGSSGSWMSVPAFGGWDMKHGVPDYSMDFTKIREMRKQNKKDFSRVSIGNEEELVAKQKEASGKECEAGHNHNVIHHNKNRHHQQQQEEHINHSQTGRKKFISCFSCCVGA